MPPLMSAFVKDPVLNLCTRGDFKEIAYSDGREIARRMRGIVQNARDRGVFSREISEGRFDAVRLHGVQDGELRGSCNRAASIRIYEGRRVSHAS